MRKLGPGAWLSIAALGAVLALAIYYVVVGSPGDREVAMSGHGWAALILGGLFTLLVGGGLVALMIYSHRRGHDR